MRLTVEIPEHFARLITMDRWEKRALLNILISEGICETATEAMTHIKGMGIENGTERWELWVEGIRSEAAQEGQERAKAWEADTEAGQAKRARRVKNGAEARS